MALLRVLAAVAHIHWERVYLPIVNMTEFNVLARHGEEEQYVLTI